MVSLVSHVTVLAHLANLSWFQLSLHLCPSSLCGAPSHMPQGVVTGHFLGLAHSPMARPLLSVPRPFLHGTSLKICTICLFIICLFYSEVNT